MLAAVLVLVPAVAALRLPNGITATQPRISLLTCSAVNAMPIGAANAVPTGEELELLLDKASQAKDDAIHARAMADELAQMPYFKKGEEQAKKQRYDDAVEWAARAEHAEAVAHEAHLAAELTLARINEHEMATGVVEPQEDQVHQVSVDIPLNGSEDRAGDINGILAITAPTVVAVLALPAIASWFNS